VLSDRLRPCLEGIEQADSIAWDAHKWLAVPLGAGMLFTRRPDALRAAFATESAYMPGSPPARPDPFTVSHLWSRRAAGVSLFAALAELGAEGYARMVDAMTERGDALREKLRAAGFRVVNDTPLPLVCFTHPAIESGSITAGELARRVRARGRAFLVATVLASGERVLRACITNHRTEERDLDALIDELHAAMAAARKA
jgi:glutamate/tyrosine decarboxylase-like PLP-dependent enzyme